MDFLKVIHSLYACCKSGNQTAIETIIEKEDLDDICTKVYYAYLDNQANVEDLNKVIDILSYLENETSIPSPVSDTIYDIILEALNDNAINNIGTSDDIITDENVKEHLYPELRGSLQKVHFVREEDIPKKDSRKSLEGYLKNALANFCKIIGDDQSLFVMCDYKWDGASNVFECSGNQVNHVLTRYKVKQNLGKDITHIYRGKTPLELFDNRIPPQFYNMGEYGVKTEIIMPQHKFEEYKKYIMDSKCNRRSAVSSITNRTDENLDPKMLEFLEIIPLQISTKTPIDGDPVTIQCGDWVWKKVGTINGRFQYIGFYSGKVFSLHSANIGRDNYRKLATELYLYREQIVQDATNKGYPIDGLVFTLLNDALIEQLGRSDDKNNFQVAFKFPAGVKKTKLKNVDFQVGPIAGTITPVAEVEPVIINGNTITHVGLSNMEKLERLDLHIGDEVIIQYDIIPKIVVDGSCMKGSGDKIVSITSCPVCGGNITSGRCVNPMCDAKIVGKIGNYTTKMNIPGFGLETIKTLVNNKIVTSIVDLYKLGLFRDQMEKLPGFQKQSVNNLVSAPLNRTNIYPHELLGSIGIPDISLATMEKVCRVIEIPTLVNFPEQLLSVYTSIDGIGETKAKKIVNGVREYSDIIKGLLPYFNFKGYEGLGTKNVVFTNIRDSVFAEFLKDKYGINNASSVSKNTIAVITEDTMHTETGSMKEANKKNIPIIGITDAKRKWEYNEK